MIEFYKILEKNNILANEAISLESISSGIYYVKLVQDSFVSTSKIDIITK